jgi:hypothetical protein
MAQSSSVCNAFHQVWVRTLRRDTAESKTDETLSSVDFADILKDYGYPFYVCKFTRMSRWSIKH